MKSAKAHSSGAGENSRALGSTLNVRTTFKDRMVLEHPGQAQLWSRSSFQAQVVATSFLTEDLERRGPTHLLIVPRDAQCGHKGHRHWAWMEVRFQHCCFIVLSLSFSSS